MRSAYGEAVDDDPGGCMEHTETLARHTELLTSAHAELDLIIELLRSQD